MLGKGGMKVRTISKEEVRRVLREINGHEAVGM